MSECSDGAPQANYTGYEVNLFRRLADRMVSAFNDTTFASDMWEFECVDWDTATLDLYKSSDDPTRYCNMSFGAIDATSSRMLKGAQFSTPTYPGSLKILVLNPEAKVDRWTFLAPFKPELWLALFGTSAAVATSIWLQEVTWRKIFTHPLPALQKLSNLQWASMALMVQILAEFSARRIGARLTILGYGFLVLIAINTYMAVLAARLTVNTIQQNVNGLDELTSKPVGVFVDYMDDIKKHTPLLNLVPLPWDNEEDEKAMLRMLRERKVEALLMDAPWVQFQAAINCDLTVVNNKQSIMPFNYGFGFPVDFSPEELADVNMALAQLMEEGIFTALENQYIKPTAVCPSKSSQADLATVQLGFGQMSGLWVFLAATMGVGWGIDFVQAAWKGWKQWRLKHPHAITPARDDSADLPTDGSVRPMRMSGFGGVNSGGVEDVELAKAYSKALPAGGAPPDRANSGPSISGTSFRSIGSRLEGRTKSFFGRPEVAESWMAVADASTVEEMVQLLEMQVRHMDSRLRKALPALERRVERSQQLILAALEEAVAAARGGGGAAGTDGGRGGAAGILYDEDFGEGSRQLLQAVTAGRSDGGSESRLKSSEAGNGPKDYITSISGAAGEDDAAGLNRVVALQAPLEAALAGRADGKSPSAAVPAASQHGARSISGSGVANPAVLALSRADYIGRRISRVQFQDLGLQSGHVSGGSNAGGGNSRSLTVTAEEVSMVLPGTSVRRTLAAAAAPAREANGPSDAVPPLPGSQPGTAPGNLVTSPLGPAGRVTNSGVGPAGRVTNSGVGQ